MQLLAFPCVTPAPIVHAINSDRLRFLHLALDSCGSFADAADNAVLWGNPSSARTSFRYAEEAFEEAQQCLGELEYEDWRVEVESILEQLGLRLDQLWIKLVAA